MSDGGEKRWYERVRAATKKDPWVGLEVCEAALREHPHSHGLHFLAGYIHVRVGQARAAVLAFERATEIDGTHAASWRELANAHVALATTASGTDPEGHRAREAWLSAAESLTQFLHLRPANAMGYLDRAIALSRLNDDAATRMGTVDGLCALSLGTLSGEDEKRADAVVSAGSSASTSAELGHHVIDRVREVARRSPLDAARLAREAAHALDAKYGLYAAALFADVGDVDQAVHELGPLLPAVGSELDLLAVVNEAAVPVSNPTAVSEAWSRANAKRSSSS